MSEQNKVIKIANKEREHIINDLKNKINIIYDGINVKNTLPESIFVNYFLKFFTGEKTSDTWVLEWISIAGTPMSRVTIIDDVTKEPLYEVPAIISSSNLNNNPTVSLSDITKRYEMENNNIPDIAKYNFYNNLDNYIQNNIQVQRNTINDEWLNIYKRYNLINNKETPVMSQNTASSIDDIIEE